MALASLDQDVKELTRTLGLTAELALLDVGWQAEIGPMREYARIVALHKASLVIEVDSHAAMQEISLRRRELVRKLNRHLPTPWVDNLTLRMSQRHGR